MEVKRIKKIDQKNDYMEDLAIKNGTTVSTCGYITCALIEYFSQLDKFHIADIYNVNQKNMTVYIQKVMNSIKKNREKQIIKFQKVMTQKDKKYYYKDWVANFEIQDYLASIKDKFINSQVYFFRQSAFDHPQAVKNIKYEEAQRSKQQQIFKGQYYFYTSFSQEVQHKKKQTFQQIIIKSNKNLPILIATDVLGHYNVTILYEGMVYILDSLSQKRNNLYDDGIVQFIVESYKKSYLKK